MTIRGIPVERFGLNAGEVQEVFQEVRDERHQEMQAHFEERLDELVASGDLTEDQKDTLLAKKAEMWESREELMNLSPEERRAKMQERREEMNAWAEENGTDLAHLGPLGKGFRNGGIGHFKPRW